MNHSVENDALTLSINENIVSTNVNELLTSAKEVIDENEGGISTLKLEFRWR